jgi:hypothetical protein
MSESRLIEKESSVLHSLEQLSVERAKAESLTAQEYQVRKDAEARASQHALQKLRIAFETESETIRTRYQEVRLGILKQRQSEHQSSAAEHAGVRQRIAARYNAGKKGARRSHEDARWQALAVFEAAKDELIKRFKQTELEILSATERLQALKDEAEPYLDDGRRYAGASPEPLLPSEAAVPVLVPEPATAAPAPAAVDPAPVPAPGEPAVNPEPAAGEIAATTMPVTALPEDPMPLYLERIKQIEEQLVPLAKLGLPRFLKPQNFLAPFVVLALGAFYPLGTVIGWTASGIVCGVATIALAVAVRIWLIKVARREVARLYHPFCRTMDEADRLHEQCQTWAKANLERGKTEVHARRERDVRVAEEKFTRTMAEIDERRAQDTRASDEKYPALQREIDARRDEALRQADERYPHRLAELEQRFERESRMLTDNYAAQKAATERVRDDAWNELAQRWRGGLEQVQATVSAIHQEEERCYFDWFRCDLEHWQYPTPTFVPPGLRFGRFVIDMNQIPDGVPQDQRLRAMGPAEYVLPALLPFPTQGSLLLRAGDNAGKTEATRLLQAMMLRYLTSVAPGKVRFTIIDPVGLGENFAAFMHLADYSELLVNSRIWTETPHIEQRLADLSAHMENVIQKYLRNEFSTIEEYNIFAGEVAEPFRVLVVANFPVNFSEAAARRLISIASSGARCGVYTLISVDLKQQLPSGCQLKDLEPHCLNLNWSPKEGRFQWRDREFAQFPLTLDAPPDAETFTRVLHDYGQRARDAHRVEVPFDFIAPQPQDYWTHDSRGGVDVPLGRAGATKLQHLRLGKGTSQHVLIAGKTGSGKSTLLHALITNAALRYSPDELELYLIDFKKGVEFKVYATLELPHARVIAVESEREFGLSVLQRLDAELKFRGDLFRAAGVQDIKGYREATEGTSSQPMPRILFIVDEFQEFFVEDDRIAQDVSLLLDRLVRQGRAFGIHVHLGSQTLGGAFSLARSTLGQMAVRIALQCSESDAHLILSEDNGAARLLTRPGEAIYNDANGMVEGNNFFQVVWLADARREEYLGTIHELALARHRPPSEQIVFEGNLPAIPRKNHLLAALLHAPAWPVPPKADQAWLGEAIAIKDPTAAVFRPQSGSNLLIVGQKDAAALGMMSLLVIGIAAQHAPANPAHPGSGVKFYLLDGSPVDSPCNGKLAQLADVIPHPLKETTWREIGATITELAEEVERRQSADAIPGPNLYLLIYDLQRFRDLRKADDDFGFSRYGEDKPVSPAKQLASILRDGPPVRVHTIVWCDSLNNLNRSFDRQGLREFEIRVLFQMSANDSSTLIDNPAAGKLGEHRALFFSEEEGKLEKFRPYAYPDEDWLASVRHQLRARPSPNGETAAAALAVPVANPLSEG